MPAEDRQQVENARIVVGSGPSVTVSQADDGRDTVKHRTGSDGMDDFLESMLDNLNCPHADHAAGLMVDRRDPVMLGGDPLPASHYDESNFLPRQEPGEDTNLDLGASQARNVASSHDTTPNDARPDNGILQQASGLAAVSLVTTSKGHKGVDATAAIPDRGRRDRSR